MSAICQCFVMGAVVFASIASADEPGRVLDRAVAIIDGQVLTLSELTLEARILFIRAGGLEAATAPLDMAALRSALDLALSNRIASAEAEALQAYPLEEGELVRAMVGFKSSFASQLAWQSFLDAHEADEATVEAVIARSLRAQRVLDGKLKLKAQVTEAEARRAQTDHPELKDLPLQTVRDSLYAQRFKSLAALEMKQSRKAAKVRLLGPFAENPDGGSR